MKYYKILDACLYHFILVVITKDIFVVMVCAIFLAFFINYIKKMKDPSLQNKILYNLNIFKNALEQGESPMHAYNRIIEDYPEYFIHPKDNNFQYKIFEKQFLLYEKKVLLDEELKSTFAIVVFRMNLMKYIPLAFMLFLGTFTKSNTFMNVVIAIAFIFTFFYSFKIMEDI